MDSNLAGEPFRKIYAKKTDLNVDSKLIPISNQSEIRNKILTIYSFSNVPGSSSVYPDLSGSTVRV